MTEAENIIAKIEILNSIITELEESAYELRRLVHCTSDARARPNGELIHLHGRPEVGPYPLHSPQPVLEVYSPKYIAALLSEKP